MAFWLFLLIWRSLFCYWMRVFQLWYRWRNHRFVFNNDWPDAVLQLVIFHPTQNKSRPLQSTWSLLAKNRCSSRYSWSSRAIRLCLCVLFFRYFSSFTSFFGFVSSFTIFFEFGFLFFLRSTLDRIRLPQCGASVSSSGPNFQSMNISPTRGNLFFNECVGLPIFFPFLPFPPVSFALVSHPFHISFASSLISFPELFSPTDNHACLGKRGYTNRVYNLFSRQWGGHPVFQVFWTEAWTDKWDRKTNSKWRPCVKGVESLQHLHVTSISESITDVGLVTGSDSSKSWDCHAIDSSSAALAAQVT